MNDNGVFWTVIAEITEPVGSRLGLPAVSVSLDKLMRPGDFGLPTNVTPGKPARSVLG